MNMPNDEVSPGAPALPNGSGAAAVLAAGIGCFVLAALAVAAEKSARLKSGLIFYEVTGTLSGVTTAAVLVWLLTWGILEWRWRKRAVPLGPTTATALVLLVLGLLLTFPPIVDLF